MIWEKLKIREIENLRVREEDGVNGENREMSIYREGFWYFWDFFPLGPLLNSL